MPIVRVAVPLYLGIVTGNDAALGINAWLILLAFTTIGFFVGTQSTSAAISRVLSGISLLLLSYSLGVILVKSNLGDKPEYEKVQTYSATVLDVYGNSTKYTRTLCRISTLDGESSFKSMVTFEIDSGQVIRSGDHVVFHSAVTKVLEHEIPGGFNRKRWIRRLGATGESFCRSGSFARVGHYSSVLESGKVHQQRLANVLERAGVTGRNLGVAKALLLGDRKGVSKDQQKQFRESGTVHVLAVSGLHVGLVYLILMFVLRPLGERLKYVKAAASIIGLWSYAWITGAAPSVMRAAGMFTVFAIASTSERKTNHFNSLAVAAVAIMVIDPLMAFSLGFRLSFLAVIGIILFYRPIYSVLVVGNRWIDKVSVLAAISLAAQLATGPLVILEFGAFPIYFLPANVMVVSLVTLLVQLGAAVLVLADIDVLGDLLASAFNGLLTILDMVTEFFAAIPFAYMPVRVDEIQVSMLYAMLVVITIGIINKRSIRVPVAAISVVFLAYWGLQVRESYSRSSLVIHDQYKGLLVTQLSGRTLKVHGDRNKWNEDRVRSYQAAVGAKIEEWSETRSDMLLIDDGLVVISGSSAVDTALLVGRHQLVLSNDVGWGKRRFITGWGARNGVPVHDIRESGAFVE